MLNINFLKFLIKFFKQCDDRLGFWFFPKQKNLHPLLYVAIIIFMSNFSKIFDEPSFRMTYFDLISQFFESNILMIVTDQKSLITFMKTNNWETDNNVLAFIQYDVILKLINGETVDLNIFNYADQSASGIGIAGILSNSRLAAIGTNIINANPDERNCIYSMFKEHLLEQFPSFEKYNFNRKWYKFQLMLHQYGAGYKSSAFQSSAWINKNIFDPSFKTKHYVPYELQQLYGPLMDRNSPVIKMVKEALKTFCPNIEFLTLFFRKIALIILCDKHHWFLEGKNALSKSDRDAIFWARDILKAHGVPLTEAYKFFGFGLTSLRIISPIGTKIEYYVMTKPKGRPKKRNVTWSRLDQNIRHKSLKSFQFKDQRAYDLKNTINSFFVNYIHSADSSVIKLFITQYDKRFSKKIPITFVHDSFGVVLNRFFSAQQIIKECYYTLGFDNHISLLTKGVIEPNFTQSRLTGANLKIRYFEILKNELIKELTLRFPVNENILKVHKKSVINSFYWFPAND